MVVNADNWIFIFFNQCTNEVVSTFLHFRVSTLNSIKFYSIAIFTSINRRYRTATKADTVVIATNNDNFVALCWFFFQTVAFFAISYTAGKHNNLVVGIFFIIFLVLES